uniref:Uncharacterized protein n=1 Tax=Setaria italica TaxID=4555 RepID=K4A0Y9_SETIT
MKPLIRLPNVQAERVCDLFLPGTRQWNEQMVRESFVALDVEEILKLKLGLHLNEDILAWSLERNVSCFWQAAREVTGCKIPDLHQDSWTRDLLSSKLCAQEEAALIICGVWRE